MNGTQSGSGIEDAVCVVTGASRGLGEAIVRYFFANGAKVALVDIVTDGAVRTARELDSSGGRVLVDEADITNEGAVAEAVGNIREHFGRIDVLVNCAGIIKHRTIEEMTLEDFESVVRVNLTGTFLMCRAVVPVMKAQRRGKIVNIASLGGRTGRPGVGVNYAASKAGIVGLTQTLAREAGPGGVCVNAIAPGPILTELTKQVPPEVFARWNVGRAVEKDGLPEDIAAAALFLASPQSDWITGAVLDVNGGLFMGC